MQSAMRHKIPFCVRDLPKCICNSVMPIWAEREARAARERNGNEADYLPVLADALLRQQKFADLLELVQPGNRDPVLESKVRTALGTAAAGLGDPAKAETLLGEAIKLDPSAAGPKHSARATTEWKQTSRSRQADRRSDRRRPTLGRSSSGQGRDARRPGRPRGAMRLFDEALKIDPKNITAHLNRADINIALGQV